MVTISLCMIVRDEEAVLARCLDSVREAVDEMVIVDTGSLDRTKEIASLYTEKVYDFPWIDDFAAARNAVMDRCRGKWYFTVDCDEWLDADLSELLAFLDERRQAVKDALPDERARSACLKELFAACLQAGRPLEEAEFLEILHRFSGRGCL